VHNLWRRQIAIYFIFPDWQCCRPTGTCCECREPAKRLVDSR